jgi:outer membrane protein assembly factor BamB
MSSPRRARAWCALRRSHLRSCLFLTASVFVIPSCGESQAPAPAGNEVVSSSPERTQSVRQAASTPYNWLQYYGGPAHSGDNTSETTLSASNVSSLQRIFQVDLPGSVADGPPVVLAGATVNGSAHDVLFLNTMLGQLVALDAHTGALLWSHPTSGASFFTNSQPAVDPSLSFVYAVGLDAAIHKYNVGSGSEVTGGWPVSFTK